MKPANLKPYGNFADHVSFGDKTVLVTRPFYQLSLEEYKVLLSHNVDVFVDDKGDLYTFGDTGGGRKLMSIKQHGYIEGQHCIVTPPTEQLKELERKLDAAKFSNKLMKDTLNEIARLVGYVPDHNQFSGDILVQKIGNILKELGKVTGTTALDTTRNMNHRNGLNFLII